MGKFADLARNIGRRLAAGQVLFRQGDAGDAMYMVYSGVLEVARDDGRGKTVLAALGPGEIVGEMALVDAQPRTATATAVGETVVIPVNAGFLKENIRKDPRFIFQIIETLILRIERTGELLRDLAADPPPSSAGLQSPHHPDLLSFLRIFRGYADPGQYAEFGPGETIFNEGEPGDLMFIILDGMVELSVVQNGGKRVLSKMDRGEFFGESALITGLARSATAQALTRVVTLPVVRKELMDGIIAYPDAALQLLQILILRLRRSLEALGPG